jgi:hypothetical protein
MAPKTFIAFILLFVLAACEKDEVRPLKIYFQVEIDASYKTESTDNWIFVTDEKGKLWDIKPFEANQTLVFDSTAVPGGKITITLMRYRENGDTYILESYVGESVGEKWLLKDFNTFEAGPFIGTLSVHMSDPNLGPSFGSRISNRFTSPGLTPRETLDSYTFPKMGIYSNADDVFIFASDRNGNPYYKFIENAVAGDYTYSLSDFSNFDKEVTYKFPETSYTALQINAFEDNQPIKGGQGYILNSYLNGAIEPDMHNAYKAGYLNRFSKYFTGVSASYPDFTLGYSSIGGIPASSTIVIENFAQAITDKSFDNFSVSSNDYQFRTSSWIARQTVGNGSMTTYWEVHSDNEHLKNSLNIPEVLIAKYPGTNTDALTHYYTTFSKSTKTFADVLAEQFKGSEVKPYEQTYKSLQ